MEPIFIKLEKGQQLAKAATDGGGWLGTTMHGIIAIYFMKSALCILFLLHFFLFCSLASLKKCPSSPNKGAAPQMDATTGIGPGVKTGAMVKNGK